MEPQKSYRSCLVFGGSFDPPHLGHQEALKAAEENYGEGNGFDRVFIVPTFDYPHLGHIQPAKAFAADFSDRVDLLKQQFNDPRFEICEIERDLPKPSYTLHTLQALARKSRCENLYLLLGEDQWQNFMFWYRYEEILDICTILVITRKGTDNKLNDLPCKLIQADTRHCSSSTIRDFLQKGQLDLAKKDLNPAVFDTIQDRGLYITKR